MPLAKVFHTSKAENWNKWLPNAIVALGMDARAFIFLVFI